MARIIDINFSAVSTHDGCTCDRCGQWIKNIWTVKFDDGITAHFGIDCYKQMCKDSRLNEYGMNVMKNILKDLEEWDKRLAKWKSEDLTAENCLSYQYEQADWNNGYWKGKSFEEYRQSWIDEICNDRIPRLKKELEKFKNIDFKR